MARRGRSARATAFAGPVKSLLISCPYVRWTHSPGTKGVFLRSDRSGQGFPYGRPHSEADAPQSDVCYRPHAGGTGSWTFSAHALVGDLVLTRKSDRGHSPSIVLAKVALCPHSPNILPVSTTVNGGGLRRVCSAPEPAGGHNPPVFDREVGMVRLTWIIGARRGGAVPSSPPIRGFLARAGGCSALLLFLVACGSDSGTPTVPGNGSDGGDPPPTPAIALTVSPGSTSVEAGSAASLTATVSRSGGFTGSVAVQVQDLPSGVSASVGDPSTSGTTSTFAVELETTATATPGEYQLTVQASGSGVSAVTQPFALAITAPPPDDDDDDDGDGNGNGDGGTGATVTLDFSGCLADFLPLWVGYQNGSQAWDRAEGDGTVFTFTLTAEVGAYAWVMGPENTAMTQITYLTRAELLDDQPVRVCVPPQGTATMTGQVEGLDSSQFAGVTLGPGFGFVSGSSPEFQITGMPEGTFDLVASRASSMDPRPDRFLLRRDVAVTDGGSLGTLDFGGAESFDPATAQVSVNGPGADDATVLMGYLSGAQCLGDNSALAILPRVGPGPVTAPGIPADRQREGDFHQLTVTSVVDDDEVAEVRFFRTLTDQSVTLPPPVEPVTTQVDGPYLRLSTTFPIPGEFLSGDAGVAILTVNQHEGAMVRTMSTSVSLARLGSATAEVTIPDLSGAPGWSAAWGIPAGPEVQWFAGVSAISSGGAAPGNVCVEGAWIRLALQEGEGVW